MNFVKKKYFKSILPSLFIIISINLNAQDTTHSKTLYLDLSKAIELATKNYPAIKAKEAEKEATKKEISSVRSEFLPSLILQDQYTYATANGAIGTFWPNEGYAMPTSGAIRNENIYTGTFGSYTTIAINWPVFSFGKIKSRVNLAKAEANEMNAEYENQIFQHQIKVTDTYLLLLAYEKLVKVQEQNLQRAQILQKTITAAANSGMRPGVDSSFANAEVSRTKILLLQSKSNEKATRIKLSELIGSADDSIIIDSMIFYNHVPAIDHQKQIEIMSNPLLRVYQNRIDVGIKRSMATMRSYFPTIKLLAAGIGRGSGISNTNDLNYSQNFFTGTGFKTYNYLMGVSFLWNLMDYPRIRNEYKREQYLTTARQFEYEEQKLKIKRELENSELQLNLAEQQVQEAPIQLAAARNGYDQVKSRYKSGLSTLPEVAQNFYILNRAEVDMTVAYNNVWRALLLKAAASGDLSLFTNEVK
jgi:outer membrane protein TolC